MTRPQLPGALAALIVLGSAGASHAQTIAVTNANFATPAFSSGGFNGGSTGTPATPDTVTIPGWSGVSVNGASYGVQAPIIGGMKAQYSQPVPNGGQVAYINGGFYSGDPLTTSQAGSYIYQDVMANLTAGTTYTLSSYFGMRLDTSGDGTLALLTSGNTLLATTPIEAPATAGTFQLETVSFTPTAADLNLGKPLRIKLTSYGSQINFTGVSLTASTPMSAPAVPEAGSFSLLALGLAPLGILAARRSRRGAPAA